MLNAMKYISTVPFSGLFNWSVQYLNDSKIAFSKAYPMKRIGEFLKRNKTAVTIQDSVKYKRVTIKVRNGGIVTRDEVMGENIGTKKQFLVSEGQFILSKIDARNGAMGIVPAELDGAVVTQDFLPYDIDTNMVNPQYFVLVCTTKQFMAFCQSCSSGTTNRQRVDEAQFLNIKVPVPSLLEQNKLVEAYNTYIIQSLYTEEQINKEESKIRQYIEECLYNNTSKAKRIGPELSFASFALIRKWGVEHINKHDNESYKHPVTTISTICQISSGGTPSRSCKEYYSGTIPWIKTGELQNNIIYDTEEHLTEVGVKYSSAKLYPKGSLVIAMYGATIGRTAMLGVSAATNQACAVLTNINQNVVLTEYLWEYLKYHSEKLKSLAYGSAQPNINAGIISDFILIVPPIALQKQMVKQIKRMHTKISELYIQLKDYRQLALTNFETKIFE